MEQLLGLATGCVGMSLDDFCRCTPSEFRAVHQAWADREQTRMRAEWERTRLTCTCLLQPWSKRRITPKDVLPLPWDEDGAPKPEPTDPATLRKRYREAMRRYGMDAGENNDQENER